MDFQRRAARTSKLLSVRNIRKNKSSTNNSGNNVQTTCKNGMDVYFTWEITDGLSEC